MNATTFPRPVVTALLASALLAAAACGGKSAPPSAGAAKGAAGTSYAVEVFKPVDGTVASDDGKIACGTSGSACKATYAASDRVVLRATADAGMQFGTWAGDCSGNAECVLDTSRSGADKYVVAVFGPAGRVGHPTWTDPALHGAAFLARLAGKPETYDCQACHGASYGGAGIVPSCNDCHEKAGWAGWQQNCSFCHGVKDAAAKAGYDPALHPEYAAPGDDVARRLVGTSNGAAGAHQAHVAASPFSKAIGCSECHTLPTSLAHVNGVDDVAFGPVASAAGAAPAWNAAAQSCSSTYCHGNFPGGNGAGASPAWTATGTITCESCHGNPPAAPHPQVARCSLCHEGYGDKGGAAPQTVNLAHHVNGVVDAPALTCATCHGTQGRSTDPLLSAAPPRGTGGETSPSQPAVGAHQAHLAPGPFASALSCFDCHDVPSSLDHVDLGAAPLAFSPLATGSASALGTGGTPSYDRATFTCSSTYCHGSFKNGASANAPVWTSGGAGAACGSCHGLPPGGTHPATARDCGNCHTGYSTSTVNPADHVNGIPDVSMSCTSCHSGALQGNDANGAPLAAAPSPGAHAAHLQGSAVRGPLACSECHAVPADTLHANPGGTVQFAFGALASTGTTATVSGSGLATSCANYCHGATLDTPGAALAMTWDSTSGTTCTSCHGFPPRTPVHQAVLTATSAAACNRCHPATVTAQGAIDVAGGHHLDGRVDAIQLTCTTCHGTVGGNAAPPLATDGASATTSVAVGAHQAHLAPKLAGAVPCTECHGAGVSSYATDHADGTVQIAFGARAGAATAWNRTSATCATSRCHGGTAPLQGGARTTPVWTQVDGTQATCDSCHGNPPPDNAHAGVTGCAGCHGDGYGPSAVVAATHVDGAVTFAPGTTCSSCHGAEHGAMTAATTYHHAMATDARVDAPYPTNNSPLDGPDKSCLMCHVRHGEFGAGETLRTSITGTSAASGDDASLCTSCHLNDQTKSSGELADATLKTAGWTDTVGWNAALNTGHNYTVAGSFPAGAAASGAFAVNCTKCHNSSTTRYQGGGTATFALHDSTDRRLRAPLGRDTVPDDQNEAFCFRCHSSTGDLDASGHPLPGALKPTDLMDWYGGHAMPNGSTGVFKQMNGTPPLPTTVTTTLNVKPAAQEAVSGNQPTGPSGENVGKVVTNALYLTSTTSAGPAGYLLGSGTYTTSTLRQHAMSITSSSASTSVTVNTTSGATAYDRLAQFLSPPVATAFTWNSGASLGLNLFRSENNTNDNCFFRYAVYRWSGGAATQIVNAANGGTEFPTTAASASQSMSLAAQTTFNVGDQILVEVEVFKNAPTNAGTCTVQWGNQTADGSRLTLPATSTGTFPEFQGTNPPQGGTWTVRSMSPTSATGTTDSITGSSTTTAYATQLWDRVSFLSPEVNAPVTLPASAWTLNVLAGRGSLASSTAYLRYRIYQWTGSNLPGLEIVPWTTSSSALGSSVANVAITTPAGAAVALSAGDKVVVEVEIETMNTTAAATANASISTNGSSVVLPAAVTWTYTAPGVTPTVGHLGSRYSGLHRPNPAEENLQDLAANKHVECSDCHDAHQARRGNQADGGTATAGANGSLTDANQSWAPNAWKGFYVSVTSGTGSGGRAQIIANTASTLTFATGTTPGAGSGYRIAMKANGGSVTAATANTLTDAQSAVGGAKAWQANAFAGWMVNVVLGPGAGESHLIASNTATQLTIADAWTTQPTTASRYVIGKPPHVMDGATGVNVTAWGASWGAANGMNPAPNSTTPLPEATTEWQVCFKCHSSANANLAGWSPTGVTFTDMAQQFNPNNASGHPVAAPAAAGSGGSTQLTSTQLVNGWKPGDVMYCSDCHGNNDTSYGASQGPHASAVPFMLRGPNTRWPMQADGITRWGLTSSNFQKSQGTPDGLFCLNCHSLSGPHTEGNHGGFACTQCHIAIPHGGKLKRLMATVSPVPWAAGTTYARYAAVYSAGNWYYASSAGGTSGSNAPTCASSTCSDGGITWTYGGTASSTPGVPAVYRDSGVPQLLKAYAGGAGESNACGALCSHHSITVNPGVNTW